MSLARILIVSLAASKLPFTVRISCSHPSDMPVTLTTTTDPNTSEEAKERAKAELEKHGINIE